jgi:hypothetical protein
VTKLGYLPVAPGWQSLDAIRAKGQCCRRLLVGPVGVWARIPEGRNAQIELMVGRFAAPRGSSGTAVGLPDDPDSGVGGPLDSATTAVALDDKGRSPAIGDCAGSGRPKADTWIWVAYR